MLVTQYLDVLKEYYTHTHTHTHVCVCVCVYTYVRGSSAHDASDAVSGRPEGVRAQALFLFLLKSEVCFNI